MYLIINLIYLFCALNLSSEQYIENPKFENTSLITEKLDILKNNEEFQMNQTERKSKVKKRPGVDEFPTILPNYLLEEKEDLDKTYSSTVPRKGAEFPSILMDENPITNLTHITSISAVNISNINTKVTTHSDILYDKINSSKLLDEVNKNINKAVDEHEALNINQKNESLVTNNASISTSQPNSSTIVTSTSIKPDVSDFDIIPTPLKDDSNSSVTPSMYNTDNTGYSSRKPSTASAQDAAKTSSMPTIIAAISIVVLVCSLIGYITYKRLYAYWNRRHYSRVDFLIDGLYEM